MICVGGNIRTMSWPENFSFGQLWGIPGKIFRTPKILPAPARTIGVFYFLGNICSLDKM